MQERAQATVTVPASERKERQLVAGRYRLAAFHRADDQTEVWRALDESTQNVVTLEFLRDASMRERFLAQGRRMASIQQPSVMRVAAISEDPNETFVVYEHLVHVPVALDALKPDAPVGLAPLPVATPPQPVVPQQVSEPPALKPAVPTPKPERAQAPIAERPVVAARVPEPALLAPMPAPAFAATAVAEPPETPSIASSERGLDDLMAALRSREFGLIDAAMVTEAAWQILEQFADAFKEIRPTEAFAIVRDVVAALVVSPIALMRGTTALRSGLHVPSLPRPKLGGGAPRTPKPPKVPKPQKVREARVESVKMPSAPRAPLKIFPHVRWGRVLTRGLVGGVIVTTAILMPPELEAKLLNLGGQLGSQVADQVGTVAPQVANQVTTAVGTAVGQAISATQSQQLAKPGFEVPPLSAYHAALETTGPAPSAKPNEMVEWVVALRNTGSAGWYRGLEGAQASLALADGTSAAVQTTSYVGPGQVGWFVARFRAASEPGTYKVTFRPRIDGLGQLADLGLFVTVTVTASP